MRRIYILPLCILLLFTFGCSKPMTEEDRVRAAVNGIAEAMEAKDLKAAIRYFSDDYNDEAGNDRSGIKGVLFHQIMRPGKLSVFVRGLEVKVEGSRALVDCKAALVRGDAIPDESAGYRFSVVFRKEDGDWKALSAKWERVGLMGLL
ncbi:MAG: nuclear transport factor 2 family protein [Thermodesulfobacteriota bacterium]